MWKYLFLGVLCLISVERGFGLRCYTTDPTQLQPNNRNLKNLSSKLQNCDDQLQEILASQSQFSPASNTNTKVDLGCYTMRLQTTNSEVDIEFKGCMIKDGCEQVEKTVGGLLQAFGAGNLACKECNSDACNSGTPRLAYPAALSLLVIAVLNVM